MAWKQIIVLKKRVKVIYHFQTMMIVITYTQKGISKRIIKKDGKEEKNK